MPEFTESLYIPLVLFFLFDILREPGRKPGCQADRTWDTGHRTVGSGVETVYKRLLCLIRHMLHGP